jgi:hypothetical protein
LTWYFPSGIVGNESVVLSWHYGKSLARRGKCTQAMKEKAVALEIEVSWTCQSHEWTDRVRQCSHRSKVHGGVDAEAGALDLRWSQMQLTLFLRFAVDTNRSNVNIDAWSVMVGSRYFEFDGWCMWAWWHLSASKLVCLSGKVDSRKWREI